MGLSQKTGKGFRVSICTRNSISQYFAADHDLDGVWQMLPQEAQWLGACVNGKKSGVSQTFFGKEKKLKCFEGVLRSVWALRSVSYETS